MTVYSYNSLKAAALQVAALSAEEKYSEEVADIAAMNALTGKPEGYIVKTLTNNINYRWNGTDTWVPFYMVCTVADIAARDALTEMVENQRVHVSDTTQAFQWKAGAWEEIFLPAVAEIADTTILPTDPSYNLPGTIDVAGLDLHGRSRRVRRIFDESGPFDYTALNYPDRTAVFIRNPDPVNGKSITYGAGGAVTLSLTKADGEQEVRGGLDTYTIQPGEFAVFERDGNDARLDIVSGERVSYFFSYADAAANAASRVAFDGIAVIRDVEEIWCRKTTVNSAAFPADGVPNADWFKVGGSENRVVYKSAGETEEVGKLNVGTGLIEPVTVVPNGLIETVKSDGTNYVAKFANEAATAWIPVDNPGGADIPDWTANTEFFTGDEVIAPMPLNADFIASDGAIVGVNYVFKALQDRPNTIAAFDEAEADGGFWELVGVFRASGTSVRFLSGGTGTMYFNPLTDLSNTSLAEHVWWATTDNPQNILFAFDPSFITIWKDYTGLGLVQPAAANETWTLPANTSLRAKRTGNAIQIVLESLENASGGDPIVEYQLVGSDIVAADTTFAMDYSTKPEQFFHTMLVSLGQHTITFDPANFGAGAFLKDRHHRVTILSNTADTTISFAAGSWNAYGARVIHPDIVIPTGETAVLEFVYDKTSAQGYVQQVGSGSEATATYNGQQRVAVKTYGEATPLATSGAFQTINMGADINGARLELDFRPTNNTHVTTASISIDAIEKGSAQGGLVHWYDTSYLRIRAVDAASLAAGDFDILHVNTAFEIIEVRAYKDAENGFVIPTATTSKTQVAVSVSGDSTTVNGGDASGAYLEGAGTNSIMVDLPAGQSIDKSATEAAINALTGVNAVVSNASTGKIDFTIDEGTGSVVFPITHVATVDGVQVFTFQQTNAAVGPATPIEGWQFDARSDLRQGRIHNVSGKERWVISNTQWRGNGAAGVIQNTIYSSYSMGFEVGEVRQLAGNDHNFTVGGGAAEGHVEYCIMDVYEFTGADRLTYEKIHTLHISMAVGHSWTDNDWRVEVHPV